MPRWTGYLGRVTLTVLLGGFFSASLVRFAPGFDTSEEQLETWRGQESLRRLRESRQQDRNIVRYYLRFLGGYLRGDLGLSSSLHRPVAALIAERARETVIAVLCGLAAGWCLGMTMALVSVRFGGILAEGVTALSSGLLQCMPAGVLALCLLFLGGQGPWLAGIGIALTVYPRVIHFVTNLLRDAAGWAHVIAARARGLGEWRVIFRHVLPVSAPQLLSLLGVSTSIACGAAIPIEVILDVPGLGQLAWQAALARDLNLLVNVAMLVTVVVTVSNAVFEGAGERIARGAGCVR